LVAPDSLRQRVCCAAEKTLLSKCHSRHGLIVLQAVSPEQARDAFRKYVDPSKLSIVKAGDKKKASAQ
jgi:predicted Zn-dependent peptidase